MVVTNSDDQPGTFFKGNAIADIQTTIVDNAEILITFIIFVCNFSHHDRDREVFDKLQIIDDHMEALGLDMLKCYRSAVRSMLMTLFFVVIMLVGFFVYGMHILLKLIDERYVFWYGIAMVIPTVHVEVLIVQFIMFSRYQLVRTRLLNEVLRKFAK